MQDEENIIKKVCSELGITQKELAEKLGSHLTTVQKWIASNELPSMAQKSIELLQENMLLKSKVQKIQTIIKLFGELKENN